MSSLTILEALKARITSTIADRYLLQAPRDDATQPPEIPEIIRTDVRVDYTPPGAATPQPAEAGGGLTHPDVIIGYLPPKGLLPEDNRYDAPVIVVGLDEAAGSDDGKEAYLNIRLTFITYGAGSYTPAGAFAPDMTGYMDLLNMIDTARDNLGAHPDVEGKAMVDVSDGSPMQWGMYEEQPWPYWYGWLSFSVQLQPVSPAYPEL